MDQTLVVIVLILALFPFFYLAKAIFFFRENRNFKYRSIYIRGLIYGLIAMVIIGAYISIPMSITKMEQNSSIVHLGAYAGIYRNDTISFDALQMKHKFGATPLNNYTSTYILSHSTTKENTWKRFSNGFASFLFGSKIEISNEVLYLSYPVKDSYYTNQLIKKNKKKPAVTIPDNSDIINRYYLSLKSDTLFLVPFNNSAVTLKYLRFANAY